MFTFFSDETIAPIDRSDLHDNAKAGPDQFEEGLEDLRQDLFASLQLLPDPSEYDLYGFAQIR